MTCLFSCKPIPFWKGVLKERIPPKGSKFYPSRADLFSNKGPFPLTHLCMDHIIRHVCQLEWSVSNSWGLALLEVFGWPRGKRSRHCISRSRIRIPLEAECNSGLYGASLHRTFHYHPSRRLDMT